MRPETFKPLACPDCGAPFDEGDMKFVCTFCGGTLQRAFKGEKMWIEDGQGRTWEITATTYLDSGDLVEDEW